MEGRSVAGGGPEGPLRAATDRRRSDQKLSALVTSPRLMVESFW